MYKSICLFEFIYLADILTVDGIVPSTDAGAQYNDCRRERVRLSSGVTHDFRQELKLLHLASLCGKIFKRTIQHTGKKEELTR